MQVTLSESRHARKRTGGGTVVSVVFHSLLLAGVITSTGISDPARPGPEVIDTLIYTPPAEPPAPVVTERSEGMTAGEVPTGIPPIPDIPVIVEPVLDIGRTAPPIIDTGGEFVRRALDTSTSTASVHLANQPYNVTTVDRVVVPSAANPTPRYPKFLAQAGVEGRVVARFVVDTLGQVEPRSLQIVQSTQEQFAVAVREIMPRMRFVPAEVRGARVRQLVEQTFQFELKH